MPSEFPLVLGFDTSAAHCAAALLSGDEIIAQSVQDMSRGQGERLIGLLEETLARAGKNWRDLDAIGVGIGPGNFTGIRISVSAARGLALGLGIPAVGVSVFDALTYRTAPPVTALVPAPRDQVYRQDRVSAGISPPRLQLRDCAMAEAAAQGHTIKQDIAAAELARNIAHIAALNWQGTPAAPAPLYVRAADAAPPRDAPPVILDP